MRCIYSSGTYGVHIATMRGPVCVWPRRRYFHRVGRWVARRSYSTGIRLYRAARGNRTDARAARIRTATADRAECGENVLARGCSCRRHTGFGAKSGRRSVIIATQVYKERGGIARTDSDSVRARDRDLNSNDAGVGRYRAPYGSAEERTYQLAPEVR